MSSAIYTRSDILQVEKKASEQGLDLVNEAATVLTDWVKRRFKKTAKILVLSGSGHNGADALLCAAKLAQLGFNVKTCPLFKPVASYTQKIWEDRKLITPTMRMTVRQLTNARLSGFDLIIDGVFGVGLNQNITDPVYALFQRINDYAKQVLAVDIPSGLNAQTGTIMGIAIRATTTITFMTPKLGLFTADGKDISGQVILHPLSVKEAEYQPFTPVAKIMHPDYALLKRRNNSHKGTYGGVQILGGAKGMLGAATMAGRAAMTLGAGKVWLHILTKTTKIDWLFPEIMFTESDIHPNATVIVCGPGLGTGKTARKLIEKLLTSDKPLVLDADALNLIAQTTEFQKILKSRTAPTILTPHPREAARLLNISTEEVQADRLTAVLKLQEQYNATILLKGSGSLTTSEQKIVFVCTAGNAALANGGQGDILAGAIGAFLAQGLRTIDALNIAVQLHAETADLYVQEDGEIGLRASICLEKMLQLLNQKIKTRATA